MQTDNQNADRRRDRWRRAQKARRERIRAGGKVLVHLWCTPDEAAQAKAAVKAHRRAERLKQIQHRGQLQTMTRHRSSLTEA
ncbi:MAG: hypothetical protein AB1651_16515 [Pseudomonadota bacterium]|jgi:hypothetical protein